MGCQAGLFSAVTSAFIIQIDSQLQPDPNDETAALLRVLIYKIDNTTFGNNPPALPQWTGPPRAIVQVQAILYSTLFLSLFSAFLAMLGKQWLNRYDSTDMHGSAIERSQNRQLKRDGIITWYFDRVLELLPLMLQAALLLLGCALFRYLWETNITLGSLVLGFTSFGALLYILIVIAGAVSESCPFQTPSAHVLRHTFHGLRHRIAPTLQSASSTITITISSNFSQLIETSFVYGALFRWRISIRKPWYSLENVGSSLLVLVILPFSIACDFYRLGRAIFRSLVSLGWITYRQVTDMGRVAYNWITDISLRTLSVEERTVMLDMKCISWILATSLDKPVRLSTFKCLISIPESTNFNPTLVTICFNTFVSCVNTSSGKVVIMQGLEQLAAVSADGFFRTLRQLTIMDPTSRVLFDLRRRYNTIFPSGVDFTGLPFHSTMENIHTLAGRFGDPRDIKWPNHRLSVKDHIPFARRMVEAAQEKYRENLPRKVPRRILRSALYFLSLGPPSPPSVVADSLGVIAIDLDCDISMLASLDERWVKILYISTHVIYQISVFGWST